MTADYLHEAKILISEALDSKGIEYKFQEGKLDPAVLDIELEEINASIRIMNIRNYLPEIMMGIRKIIKIENGRSYC